MENITQNIDAIKRAVAAGPLFSQIDWKRGERILDANYDGVNIWIEFADYEGWHVATEIELFSIVSAIAAGEA